MKTGKIFSESIRGTAALRRGLGIVSAVILGLGAAAGSVQAQTLLYDANSGNNAGGVFGPVPGGQFYMQQLSLAPSNATSYTLTSMLFGIRWTDITVGTQVVFLDFYTGVDTSATSTNALSPATQFSSVGFSLTAPTANGSYNYTLPLPSIVAPSSTFAVAATLTNAAGTAQATGITYRFSNGGAPATGSNTGFVWIDGNSNNVLTGAEQMAGVNIRMTITGTAAVPEPGTNVALALGGLALSGGWLVRRRSAAI